MFILPAIFIRNGKCNPYTNQTLPWQLAMEYEEMGATSLHVIDIDGAETGTLMNEEGISAILTKTSLPVEVGGGIRHLKDVEHLLSLGASRIIIGTKAVGNPAFVKDVIANFGPQKILVSIDTKDGFVVTNGFGTINPVRVMEHAMEMLEYGVRNICYVDASNKLHAAYSFCEEVEELYRRTGLNIIAMGNVESLKDLERLKEANADGVVLEKNEFQQELNIKRAIEIFEKGDHYGSQEDNWLY